MLKMDGYDDCVIGVVERFGMDPILCYDKNKVIGKLMADGLYYEDAVEWYEFNMLGGWHGDETPCFIELGDMDECLEGYGDGE